VRREGRLTPGQRSALSQLGPRYEIDPCSLPQGFARIFGRTAPVTLEIGFGNGEALAVLAENAPERDFIGIEVHRPGIGHLLRLLEHKGLTNVRVICEDAAVVLREYVPAESFAEVLLWFPDPWPKKRHHKRRLVQPEFIRQLHNVLAADGKLHLATDWGDYAQYMLCVVEADDGFNNVFGPGCFASRPVSRPSTKFESRGLRLGNAVWDLIYRRI
jgi:tRNA (guanine-N7-)-methyltransferase